MITTIDALIAVMQSPGAVLYIPDDGIASLPYVHLKGAGNVSATALEIHRITAMQVKGNKAFKKIGVQNGITSYTLTKP